MFFGFLVKFWCCAAGRYRLVVLTCRIFLVLFLCGSFFMSCLYHKDLACDRLRQYGVARTVMVGNGGDIGDFVVLLSCRPASKPLTLGPRGAIQLVSKAYWTKVCSLSPKWGRRARFYSMALFLSSVISIRSLYFFPFFKK